MKSNNKNINVNLAYYEAQGFVDAAYSLKRAISKNGLLLPRYASAYMVNLGFAAEVYLKLLLYFYDIEYDRIHKLKDLFDLLSDKEQAFINGEFDKGKEEYHKTIGNFDFSKDVQTCLNDYNNAFVDWRYDFEEKNKTLKMSWADLNLVIEVLKARVKALYNITI